MRNLLLATVAMVTLGCGGSSAPAQGAGDVAKSTKNVEASKSGHGTDGQGAERSVAPEKMGIPTGCVDGSSDPCIMPPSFVKRLCAEAYPELALYFFAKDSPWTRAYVSAREVEPFNGLGGPSSDKNLVFDEELLVLAKRSPNLGGMSVSGVGDSYDVLRWDGTCATLQAGEVRFQRPPRPENAAVDWTHLGIEIRDALHVDDKIKELAELRRRECKGVTMGAVSDKCEKADTALKTRVVTVIRDGFQIPKPAQLP